MSLTSLITENNLKNKNFFYLSIGILIKKLYLCHRNGGILPSCIQKQMLIYGTVGNNGKDRLRDEGSV